MVYGGFWHRLLDQCDSYYNWLHPRFHPLSVSLDRDRIMALDTNTRLRGRRSGTVMVANSYCRYVWFVWVERKWQTHHGKDVTKHPFLIFSKEFEERSRWKGNGQDGFFGMWLLLFPSPPPQGLARGILHRVTNTSFCQGTLMTTSKGDMGIIRLAVTSTLNKPGLSSPIVLFLSSMARAAWRVQFGCRLSLMPS